MIKDKKIYWLKKLSRYNLNILVLENCILNIKDKDKIYLSMNLRQDITYFNNQKNKIKFHL